MLDVLTDKPEDIYQEFKDAVDGFNDADYVFGRAMLGGLMGKIMAAGQQRAQAKRDLRDTEKMSIGYYNLNQHLLYEEAAHQVYDVEGLDRPDEELYASNVIPTND